MFSGRKHPGCALVAARRPGTLTRAKSAARSEFAGQGWGRADRGCVPRLTGGISLPRPLLGLRSNGLSRRLVTLASAGAFCLAFTAMTAVSWSASPASASFAALTRFPPPSPSPSAALTPRQIAGQMLAQYGWAAGQFSCLDPLWTHESGWNPHAQNPRSGAYGIPQALPGDKMASAGPDWLSNPATQIRWGLAYIQDRYGTPCGAWSHQQATGWY
jgi:hypothetical protein